MGFGCFPVRLRITEAKEIRGYYTLVVSELVLCPKRYVISTCRLIFRYRVRHFVNLVDLNMVLKCNQLGE